MNKYIIHFYFNSNNSNDNYTFFRAALMTGPDDMVSATLRRTISDFFKGSRIFYE